MVAIESTAPSHGDTATMAAAAPPQAPPSNFTAQAHFGLTVQRPVNARTHEGTTSHAVHERTKASSSDGRLNGLAN